MCAHMCYIPYLWTFMGISHSSYICLTQLWGGENRLTLTAVIFFTLLASIVFCYKDFHFISNLRFGYFSYSNFFVRLQQYVSVWAHQSRYIRGGYMFVCPCVWLQFDHWCVYIYRSLDISSWVCWMQVWPYVFCAETTYPLHPIKVDMVR